MSGCCRIDPIHHGGIYIPVVPPRPSESLSLFLVVFPIFPFFPTPGPATMEGGFLPCGRLCRHFPGGACAATLLSLQPLRLPRVPTLRNFQPPTTSSSVSPFFRLPFDRLSPRCNRPLSTRQISTRLGLAFRGRLGIALGRFLGF